MNENYKNVDIEKIANELDENGNFDETTIIEFTKKYNFSSQEDLREKLISYYMKNYSQKYKMRDKKLTQKEIHEFVTKDKDMSIELKKDIYDSYIFKKESPKKIMRERSITDFHLKSIIIELNGVYAIELTNFIIQQLKNEEISIQKILKNYFIPRNLLLKIIALHKDGKETLDNYRKKVNEKKDIPIEVIVEAYRSNNLEKLAEEKHVSESWLRKKLKDTYDDYSKLLDNDELSTENKYNKKIILHLFQYNGYSIFQINKETQYHTTLIEKVLNDYYSKFGQSIPRLVKKAIFLNSLKFKQSLKEVIEDAKSSNRLIPQAYIDEYLNAKDEKQIDIESIKKIVSNELNELKQNNQNQDLTEPYTFLKQIKERGYSPSFQIVGVLYKLIKNSNMAQENIENILKNIDNENIKNAVNILINTDMTEDEYLANIEKNILAKSIYLEEKLEEHNKRMAITSNMQNETNNKDNLQNTECSSTNAVPKTPSFDEL